MNTHFKNIKQRSILLIAFFFFLKFNMYGQDEISDTAAERLIEIGNHKLFVSIKGNQDAQFTVVFESGAGGGSGEWTKVISMLPPGIRTIAYDRAGAGKSEKGPLPQTMAQNVFELHELLKAARIKGSIILVG